MSELTDLQICKRIAEIEGLDLLKDDELDKSLLIAGELIVVNERWEGGSLKQFMIYNPLTDDALWAQLIIKHEVSINFNFCLLNINTDKFYEKNFHDIEDLKVKSLELIIEAHNG